MTWTQRTAAAAGVDVHYREIGPPDAPQTVVLIHGFPLGAGMWEPQRVPPGWRAIAPALPGFDGAPLPDPGSTAMDDYARPVLALLDELGVRSAVIGGVSMGGYVVFALWRLAASRCRALILADTRASADPAAGRAGRDRMIDLVRREGPSAVGEEMLPKLLGAGTHAERPEVVAAVRRLIAAQSSDGIAAALVRLRDRPDATALLPAIDAPALVIVGEEDTLTPPGDSEQLCAALPHASLVRIPGAGHLSNLEDPDAFNAALARFLTALA